MSIIIVIHIVYVYISISLKCFIFKFDIFDVNVSNILILFHTTSKFKCYNFYRTLLSFILFLLTWLKTLSLTCLYKYSVIYFFSVCFLLVYFSTLYSLFRFSSLVLWINGHGDSDSFFFSSYQSINHIFKLNFVERHSIIT